MNKLYGVTLLMAVLGYGQAHALSARECTFEVLLDGDPVGSHKFSFAPLQNGYRMTSSANYRVTFFAIPVFRYQHHAEEIWRDGCLQKIDSETNENGKKYQVNGIQQQDVFELQLLQEELEYAETCISSFAYWQPALLKTEQLLNSQTGKLEEIGYSEIGLSSPPWEDSLQAETVLLSTVEGDITLWYQQGEWLGLRSILKNGHELLYKPAENVAACNSSALEESAS